MPHLIVQQPDQSAFSVDLCDRMYAGRHGKNEIVLPDPKASRQHARFSLEDNGSYTVTDLASTHGTLVNGERITVRTLADGDRIQIGHIVLTYVDGGAATEVVHHKVTEANTAPRAAKDEAGRRLRVLDEVARAVEEVEDGGALLGRMLEAILDILECERGVVALRETTSDGEEALRRIARSRAPNEKGDVVISRALIEAAIVRREAVIARDPSRAKTMIREKILSAMCAPLAVGARVLGMIYVDDHGTTDRFKEEDLDFLSALARVTAAALESAERYRSVVGAIEVLTEESPLRELVGSSDCMQRLRAEIAKFAATPSTHVLIRGESGTGKELVARSLHALSPRASRPLVTLNCAAIPETMIESELFGHTKGAFTGASTDKRGKFILADKGTLFLDEIGDLSLAAQAKVLRAVQQGEVQPLGSEKTLHVDVRILSATHKDLAAEVAAGRFREDLFYRLNILELSVPPLRQRTDDIPLLARVFLASASAKIGKRVTGFTPRALAALERYRWPGNVRELWNEVERAVIVADVAAAGGEAIVDIDDLSGRVAEARAPMLRDMKRSMEERFAELDVIEQELVEEALKAARGNVAEAARLLGISRVMMKSRMKRFGLEDDEPA